MADFKSVLALTMSGLIADKVFRTLPNGKIIVNQKAATPTFADKDVEEARDLRMKGFGGSSHIVPVVLPAIRLGYVGLKRGQQPANQFLKENATTLCDAVRDEEGKLQRVYDYRVMQLSRGTVVGGNITVTVTPESDTVSFQQEADSVASASKNPKDQLYGFILESSLEEGILVTLRKRGESGATTESIPATWDKSKIFIYTQVLFHDKKRASNSVCHYPAQSARDPLVKVTFNEEELPENEKKADTLVTDIDAGTPDATPRTIITIAKTRQKRVNPWINPKDRVYAILLDTGSDTVKLLDLGERGKKQTVRLLLGEEVDPRDVYVYTFAVLHDFSGASVPRCPHAPEGVRVPGITVNRDDKSLAFTPVAFAPEDNAKAETPPDEATDAINETTDTTGETDTATGETKTDASDTTVKPARKKIAKPLEPASHLYAMVFDAYARRLEVLPLTPGDTGQTATFNPKYKYAGRARFVYTIAISDDGKTETIEN